jgi:cytochrome P450
VRSLALGFLKRPECRRQWREFYELAYSVSPLYLGHGEWLVAGREDVIVVMKDKGSELTALYPATRSPAINELLLGMLPFEQGAAHHRLRSLTNSLFSTTAISCLQNDISALLDELLFPAVFEQEGCDVLKTLGVRVPEAMSCLLLDVSPADWQAVGDWSRQLYKQMGRYDQSEDEIREAEATYRAFCEYVHRRMRGQGTVRYGGVGEALLAAWRNGDLDDKQLLSYFTLFMLTGLDTLTHAIGNSVWFLGNAREVFLMLKQDPGLVNSVFDEAMRLWGPIRLCVRHLQNEVKLSSVTLPEGSIVFLLIHAANRDPARLERPDELVCHRKIGEDLAFGVGAHGCLGTAVGKMIGRTLFRTLALRCRSLRANPDFDDFIPSLPILGIASVRLFAEPA